MNRLARVMLTKQEIRTILLHEFKLGHNAAVATRNINKAWGDETASERTVRRWFKKFRAGDTSLKDEKGRGRPSGFDNFKLKAIVEANPLITTREVAKEFNVNHSTVVRHLKQIGKVKKLDKWMPGEMTSNQNNCHFEVCSSLLLRNSNDPYLQQILAQYLMTSFDHFMSEEGPRLIPSVLSSEEDKLQDQETRLQWNHESDFKNKEEAFVAVENEQTWRFHYLNFTSTGVKCFYQCNKSKNKGSGCDARLYLLFHNNNTTVSLFRCDVQHNQDESENITYLNRLGEENNKLITQKT